MRMPLFRRPKRWASLVAGLALTSILLTACGENSPSILDPAGPIARSESNVFWIILIIAAIVFVGVEGVLIYSTFRFRERPDSPTPPQIHGNTTVELIWTIIPAVVLLAVLSVTIKGIFDVATPPANSTNTVEVTAYGHQWWWEFYYPEYKMTTADTLVIPPHTNVHVKLYSNNVIHSFWVPALTGKTDVIPGHDNEKWFSADTPDKTYLGICAEYCGTQHANMRFDVQVTHDNNGFLSWAQTQQQAAAVPAPGSLEAKGQEVFKNQCTTCHGIVGVSQSTPYLQDPNPVGRCDDPQNANGCLIGPNLTHFGSRHLIAGGVLDYKAQDCNPGGDLSNCNLAKWISDPQKVKPGNDMTVNVAKSDLPALVAYLESLK
ncbi:cytochrome c oxidase, subunit II [Ktedonobacter racemifer DSM 44963]|uniref:Cytochrome c oxidase subunit 2 n=2 Tax=Ktedonobacter racemifer TaxID=363277 RepID=D6TNG5_KTERA|nr:cytochrome c oxidase, subunit II [Ktedonobacter racemifer DSM 44963]